jgi:hypothetical protein
MIEVQRENDDMAVLIAGTDVEILDAGDEYILAHCDLADLANEVSQALSNGLTLQVHSEGGFGTYLFHEIELFGAQGGMALSFRCHTRTSTGRGNSVSRRFWLLSGIKLATTTTGR